MIHDVLILSVLLCISICLFKSSHFILAETFFSIDTFNKKDKKIDAL